MASAIPVIPGSFQVNTPTAGVQANFNALDQPNRVDAATGQTIGAIGRELGDFAIKLQEGVNYGIAADADAKMRQTAADFQQSLIGRTDEDQWENQWAEKSNQVWQNIQETNRIGPSLRSRLTANFKEWQASNAIEVRTVANKQRINRAIERVGLMADQSARDGDENGVMAAFDGAVENHLMLPEQAAKAKAAYGSKIDEYAGRNYIMANPAQAMEYISEKDKDGKYVNLKRLNPDERMTLLNTAQVKFTQYQSENYQDLMDGLNQGKAATREELQLLVDQKVITPKQMKSYQAAYRHGGYNTDAADIGQMFADVTTYNPGEDPKFLQRAELMGRIATSGYPQNIQSQLNDLLNAKTDPKSVFNKPVPQSFFAQATQLRSSGAFLPVGALSGDTENRIGEITSARENYVRALEKADSFSENDDSDIAKAARAAARAAKAKTTLLERSGVTQEDRADWEKRATPEERDAEAKGYADYLTKMRDFFTNHPDATQSEAEEAAQSIRRPQVMAKVSAALNQPTLKNVTQEEYSALPSGARYYWNGQYLTKK